MSVKGAVGETGGIPGLIPTSRNREPTPVSGIPPSPATCITPAETVPFFRNPVSSTDQHPAWLPEPLSHVVLQVVADLVRIPLAR